jgi:fructose-bisphosphate aldolase, class II
MGLVTMTDMLVAAKLGKYAVGAFNIVDYTSAVAVMRAAEQLRAPVIVQTSVKTVQFWGAAAIVSWMKRLAGESPVPVALHLDHCRDVDFVQVCIDAGWTSVMIDASARPLEENLAMTRRVLEMAEAAGVSVEAEMGRIVGVEDDIFVKEEDANLADPDEAVDFCKGLRLAAFAPAIGTAHGVYKGEPKIAFDRIEEIAQRTGVPLALHGGTGLSDDVFQKAIALGCAKVNISTAIKYAFIDGFVDFHNAQKKYEPLKPLEAQLERVHAEVVKNIKLFGSEGKADQPGG